MKVLDERGETHGDYEVTARVAQEIKQSLREAAVSGHGGLDGFGDDMLESMDLIATKLARIASGDPNEIDHWIDIMGYAGLIVRRLERDRNPMLVIDCRGAE